MTPLGPDTARAAIALLPADRLLKISPEVGLHLAMGEAAALAAPPENSHSLPKSLPGFPPAGNYIPDPMDPEEIASDGHRATWASRPPHPPPGR
jgi:hypothetical protein